MSYLRANTQPTTGWRPGTTRLGEVRPVRHRRIHRVFIGDDGYDPSTDPVFQETGIPSEQQSAPSEDDLRNQLSSITQKFVQVNQAMVEQERLVAANPGVFSPQVGQQLMANRNDFESLWAKYVWVYRALYGTTPNALSALGVIPVATALIIAGVIAALIAGIALLWQHLQNNAAQIQVEMQQAQNNSKLASQADTLQKQITDADARGDTATAAALRSQYAAVMNAMGNAPNSSSMGAWFQNNWGWLAATAAGLVALNKL